MSCSPGYPIIHNNTSKITKYGQDGQYETATQTGHVSGVANEIMRGRKLKMAAAWLKL